MYIYTYTYVYGQTIDILYLTLDSNLMRLRHGGQPGQAAQRLRLHVYVYLRSYPCVYVCMHTCISTPFISSRFMLPFVEEKCRTVPVVPLFFKRLEEKRHNWYSTALFLYEISAFWKALTRLPQSSSGTTGTVRYFFSTPLSPRQMPATPVHGSYPRANNRSHFSHCMVLT